jgi:hypothetical protein
MRNACSITKQMGQLTEDKEPLVLCQPVVPIAQVLAQVDLFSCPERRL